MSKPELEVVESTRQVFEQKLLGVLDSDSEQVAILATESDLNMLIDALGQPLCSEKSKQWARDLARLRKESFGV